MNNCLTRLRDRCNPRVALAMLVMSLATMMSLAPPALAKAPTGDFAVFSQCPRFTAGVNFCIYAETKSGEVTLNKQTVPITKTIVLQGGFIATEEPETETFVGAINGETLSKTPQNVPGGLLGLINCKEITGEGFLEKLSRKTCEAIFENQITGVTATTELARPASEIGISTNNLVNQNGTALSLPVKVHLENPALGSNCYIGSSAHPIIWNLTTGTTAPPPPNKPIKGRVGALEEKDEGGLLEIIGNKLVDNSFAAPEATGCGGLLSSLIDPLINAKIGLPSAAGKNTAILEGTLKQATAERVIASEK